MHLVHQAQDSFAPCDVFAGIRAVMDVLPVGIHLIEMTGAPTEARSAKCNPAYARLIGCEPTSGSLAPELPYAYFHQDRTTPLPHSEWPGARALATGQPVPEHELQLRRADGEWRVVLVSAAPIRDEGVIRGAVITSKDITSQKDLERALRTAMQEAERHAAEVRDLDRRKDEFLAVLSHELRNPLAPIRNSVTILSREPADPERTRRAISVVDRQVTHLTRLVDDLLDVNRITHGKIQLQPERVELGDVVRRAVDDHQSVLAAQGVHLTLTAPGSQVWVMADATRIAQVIGNLLQNAAKFTSAGGHVAVSIEEPGSDGTVVVRVADDGVGIAPDMQTRIFQPFAQAARNRHAAHGGLGLGLALVKGLVEMHGGTVSVSSEGPGKGSEFAFTVPLGCDGDVEIRSGPARVDAGAAPRRKVLVIEDNVDAAETLRELLEVAGHEVDVALNGTAGIDAASQRPADMVLCDIGLPDMTGFEVARTLRTRVGFVGKLVALTGYASPEDERLALEAGFDRHLSKPADLDEIAAILDDRDCWSRAP